VWKRSYGGSVPHRPELPQSRWFDPVLTFFVTKSVLQEGHPSFPHGRGLDFRPLKPPKVKAKTKKRQMDDELAPTSPCPINEMNLLAGNMVTLAMKN
jgi:hypothetical protein